MNATWLLVIIGTFALLVTLVAIVRAASAIPASSAPNGWNATVEGQVWAEKLRTAADDFGLAGVRTAATAWGASITALLGIFAAVAVIKGPDSLTSVGGWQAQVAAVLILLANAVGIVAVLLCALAAQGVPVWKEGVNPWSFRTAIRTRAQKATSQLELSRYLVVVVLILVAEALGLTWLTAVGHAPAKSVHAMVVTDSNVICGQLSSQDGVVLLVTGDRNMRIRNAAQVIVVDNCP